MRRPRSDRVLRKLVAELTELGSEDLAAILETLEPEEQARVEGLLQQYRTNIVIDVTPVDRSDEPRGAELTVPGASPWLLERLEEPGANSGAKTSEFFVMTDAARSALKAAVEPFQIVAGAGPSIRRGPSLVGRMRQLIVRQRP